MKGREGTRHLWLQVPLHDHVKVGKARLPNFIRRLVGHH